MTLEKQDAGIITTQAHWGISVTLHGTVMEITVQRHHHHSRMYYGMKEVGIPENGIPKERGTAEQNTESTQHLETEDRNLFTTGFLPKFSIMECNIMMDLKVIPKYHEIERTPCRNFNQGCT